MPEAISADVTAELLLWYYEEPGRYRAEGRRRDAPVLDSTVVLKLALGRHVDLAKPALGSPETLSTLRAAAGLYVRFLFFRPDATPYQMLGLAPGASPEAIKESFRLLMHLVHPDRQDERAVWPESYAALANRAYGILRNQDSRVQLEREAQARAAMARARAVNRTAETQRASRMPVPVRPRRGKKRGPLDGVVLPEWLTAGVGGFAREHPSVTAFTALIGAAVVAVALMVWEQHDGALTRDVDATADDSGAPSMARFPKLKWLSPAPDTSMANALANGAGGSGATNRSSLPDTKALPPSVMTAPMAAADVPRNASPAIEAASAALSRSDATITPSATNSGVAAEPGAASGTEPVAPPQTAAVQPPSLPLTSTTPPAAHTVAAHSVVPTSAANTVASGPAPVLARIETPPTPGIAPSAPPATSSNAPGAPPATSEIESLFATFVESYERGRGDVFANLFDIDAEANLRQGRPAIRGEYDELFRLSQWRKMQLTRVNWKRVGDRAFAKGEVTVKIGWRDGREVEQRLALDMELVRRDGRVVIAKLSQQPK